MNKITALALLALAGCAGVQPPEQVPEKPRHPVLLCAPVVVDGEQLIACLDARDVRDRRR